MRPATRPSAAPARRSRKPSVPARWKRGPQRPSRPFAPRKPTRTCAPVRVRCLPAEARLPLHRPWSSQRHLPIRLKPSPPTSGTVSQRCAAIPLDSAAVRWTCVLVWVWTMPRWLLWCNASGQRLRLTARWTLLLLARPPNLFVPFVLHPRAGAPLLLRRDVLFRRPPELPWCTMRWPTEGPTPT